MTQPDPVARLRDELDVLERAYSTGHHGRWSANRRAEAFDRALAALFEQTGSPPGVALAALGGYGRRLQLPASDVDLLVLHRDMETTQLETLVGELLYPLWDAGVAVGQAVRTPQECVQIGAERLDALTAMLDARFLCGDRELLDSTLDEVLRPVRADPEVFAGRVLAARLARETRYGNAGNALEPDLKEALGGLRDVASLGWLERAIGQELEPAGLLRPSERAAVDAAEEFLVRARSALHLVTGKRTDRLLAELQPDVADAMGFADEPRLPAVDALMRATFEHARQVGSVVTWVFDRLEAGAGSTTEGLEDASQLDAEGVLVALAEFAAEERAPSLASLDAIANADVADEVTWTHGIRNAFLRLLASRDGGVGALRLLDRLGLLTRYLPAWSEIRYRPQRDPYHRSTVDTHLTETLRIVAASLAGPSADDPVEAEARNAITDPDAVRLGALLHDIGKIGAGEHVVVGASVAAATLRSMQVPEPTRDLAQFLVDHHLLLPDTATRRDLTDERLIVDVAAVVGTPERLAGLYLLAKADALATGPAAWTSWRRTLVRELVAKVQRAFERGEMDVEVAARLNERIGRLRDLLAGEPEPTIDRFVLRMPRSYFLAMEPAQARRHFSAIAPPLGSDEVRTTAAPGSRSGAYELLVVAQDRPGLLSQIAGSLTLAGLSILTAQIFTTDDDVAVDVFDVEGAFQGDIGEERWREFRTTLRRAFEGRISLDHRMDEKRRHYPPPRLESPVTITVDNEVSEFATVIEVGAPDRLGLLFDVTRAFADLKLDVRLAKVATYTGRVIDSFYLRDALGAKVTGPGQTEEIEEAVRARLGG